MSVRKLLSIAVICFLLLGCKRDATIAVPPFQINVKLSEDAAKKLSENGETIKGHVFFDGDGIPKKGEDTAPFRPVFLGQYDFEMQTAGMLTVNEAKISQEAFGRLSDRNYYYTVNVVSGRHVFKNNILRDGYADGRISKTVSSPIEVSCDLAAPENIR